MTKSLNISAQHHRLVIVISAASSVLKDVVSNNFARYIHIEEVIVQLQSTAEVGSMPECLLAAVVGEASMKYTVAY